jgi:hypothetical protein
MTQIVNDRQNITHGLECEHIQNHENGASFVCLLLVTKNVKTNQPMAIYDLVCLTLFVNAEVVLRISFSWK